MARRGTALREHILDTAKLAFLETGFERTSMDAIAARAQTSKRSLYAHFPTKDALFTAVVERVRVLFEDRILEPSDYGDQPLEAVVGYCGRLAQLLRWSSVTLTLRMGVAEAARHPDLAAGLYDALFGVAVRHLAPYLAEHWTSAPEAAETTAHQLVGVATHPVLMRVLLGLEPTTDDLPDRRLLAQDVDLPALRRAAQALLSPAPDGGDPR